MYHKFSLGVAVVFTHKTKEAMNKLHSLMGFYWPTDEIEALHKKYYSLEEEQPEEEDQSLPSILATPESFVQDVYIGRMI